MERGFPASRRAFKEYAISVNKEESYQYLKQDDLMDFVELAYQNPPDFPKAMWDRYQVNIDHHNLTSDDPIEYWQEVCLGWILDQLEFRRKAVVASKKLGNRQRAKLLKHIVFSIMQKDVLQKQYGRNDTPLASHLQWPTPAGMSQSDASSALSRLEALGLAVTNRPPGEKTRATEVGLSLLGWQTFLFVTDHLVLFSQKRVWRNGGSDRLVFGSEPIQEEFYKFCEATTRK